MTHERLSAIRTQLDLWRLVDVDVLNSAALADMFVDARNMVHELVAAATEDATHTQGPDLQTVTKMVQALVKEIAEQGQLIEQISALVHAQADGHFSRNSTH